MPAHTLKADRIWSFRLILVCFAAASASLPMAWISIAKVFIFVFGLIYIVADHYKKRNNAGLETLWTSRIIIAILLAFSLSIMWTNSDLDIALLAFVKHSKLLEILLLISLIRTAQEARLAMTVFAIGQVILLSSSWLMAVGIPIPWATSAGMKYVVFSTYLDQSIIFATMAALFWHLRSDLFWPRWLAALLAVAALVNALILLEGRTGYAVAITVISFAVMWTMPKRLRLASMIATPIIAILSLLLMSAQVQDRLTRVVHESQNYASQGANESSSGFRLNAWQRSIQAMIESPGLGHGVGSWTITVKRLEGSAATKVFGESNASNPHQEYLLWGVELGIAGILILIAFMACVVRDSMRFNISISRTIISVVAAMAVACMFNSTLYDALIGDFFCIALGLLIALGMRTTTNPSEQSWPASELERLKVNT